MKKKLDKHSDNSYINTIGKRLLSMPEAADYLGLGKHTARKYVEDAGALIQIGGRVLCDKTRLDAYIDSIAGGAEEEL